MRIGLDFDGVISDCGKLKSDGARELYGVDIPPERFKKELVVGKNILTAKQYRELQRIIYSTRAVGLKMQPVIGALEYIPQLVADGHTVLVVTSRDDIALEIAQEWSLKQGLALDFVGVGHGKSKAEAVVEAELDFYVDDDIDKLEPLVGLVSHRFLFSWGYNAHIDTGSVAERIVSWQELYIIVRTLSA